MTPWPPSLVSIGGYICQFIAGNRGSTRSLGNVLSALRCYARGSGLPWLSTSDAYRLQRLRQQLEYHDTTPSRIKKAATLGIVHRVVSQLDPSRLENRWFALCCLLAHNGLLRGGELFSGIRVQDVEWDFSSRSVALQLFRTKTHRRGDPIIVRIPDYPGLSAYKALLSWFEEHRLWRHPHLFLIPDLTISTDAPPQAHFQREGLIQGWRGMIKRLFAAAGLPSEQYSGHSFRAGGATDLFSMRVPYPMVKQAGRWRSDAALRYYRNDYGVAEAVAQAFAESISSLPTTLC